MLPTSPAATCRLRKTFRRCTLRLPAHFLLYCPSPWDPDRPLRDASTMPASAGVGDHSFGCTRAGGGVRSGLWHDKLRDTWEMLARLAGCSVKHEVTGFIPTSSMRADFAISDTHARTTTLFDVVTCCPTHHNSSTNLCRNAAAMPGKAAGDGELYKRKKWLHHLSLIHI